MYSELMGIKRVFRLQYKIDQMVYELYGLTKEEKEIVEESFKQEG